MTFDFDPKATDDLQRCLNGTTQEALRKEINRRLPKPYSKGHFSKMATGKRPVSPAVSRIITVMLTEGASTFIQIPSPCGVLRGVIRSLQERDFAAVVETVDAVAAGFKLKATLDAEAATTWVRLLALKANALRGQGDVDGAWCVYGEAAKVAQAVAPVLYARYRLSETSWGVESATLRYRRGEMPEEAYRARLKEFLKTTIGVAVHDPKDVELRLRVVLRTASLLDDEKTFTHYLQLARVHPTFGNEPEDRDAALRRWMSPAHDPDKDFKNASYFKVMKELRPLNRQTKDRS